MKSFKFPKTTLVLMVFLGLLMAMIFSCAETKMIKDKSGAQLWSENCQRCHNTPAPTSFSREQWKTIGLHMQSRALLTESEKNKIFEFLASAH